MSSRISLFKFQSASVWLLLVAVSSSAAWSQEAEQEVTVPAPVEASAGSSESRDPATSADQPQSVEDLQSTKEVATPDTPAPPESFEELELTDEEKALVAQFEVEHMKLAQLLGDMREIYVQFMNDVDSSRQAETKYRQTRNDVRQQFNATYDAAMAVIRLIPHEQAVSFIATWIQYRESHDIYSLDTFEGAARLIDGGVNFMFLFLAGARSAVVSGEFERAKMLYEAMEEEKLEKHDLSLLYQLDKLEENWKREQTALEADAQNGQLPQVKLTTTRGDVLLELFINQAPQATANFINLVEDGFYDSLEFYQVVDHLLALTGDPSGNGSGNSGKFVPDEGDRDDARLPMRGSLVMAKLPLGESGGFVPNSASSQFAILLLPLAQPMDQTVFGRVIEGMDVISTLRRVDPNKEKKKNEVQVPPDRILTAEVIRRPEKLPEIEYATPGVANKK